MDFGSKISKSIKDQAETCENERSDAEDRAVEFPQSRLEADVERRCS